MEERCSLVSILSLKFLLVACASCFLFVVRVDVAVGSNENSFDAMVWQVFCTGRNEQRLQQLGFPYHAADLTEACIHHFIYVYMYVCIHTKHTHVRFTHVGACAVWLSSCSRTN